MLGTPTSSCSSRSQAECGSPWVAPPQRSAPAQEGAACFAAHTSRPGATNLTRAAQGTPLSLAATPSLILLSNHTEVDRQTAPSMTPSFHKPNQHIARNFLCTAGSRHTCTTSATHSAAQHTLLLGQAPAQAVPIPSSRLAVTQLGGEVLPRWGGGCQSIGVLIVKSCVFSVSA